MENGESNIEDKFSGLSVSHSISVNGNDGLFQVMKAVEAADATIRQQVEENNRLRSELQKRNEELEKYKFSDLKYQSSHLRDQWDDDMNEPQRMDQVIVGLGNHVGGIGNVAPNLAHDSTNTVANLQDQMQNVGDYPVKSQSRNFLDNGDENGSLKEIRGGQVAPENSNFTQFHSPASASFPLRRSTLEKNPESRIKISDVGLIALSEVANFNNAKQDLVVKIREHEEEILQLKKHLSEYSVKEAQICQEKSALEKRISYMRMAFDQQQQDLVDAASKAISYRQDIMEENVRLTYALQAAQQERSTFVSSLMPLLAEYSLQPTVADAQSIVSNIKVLFRHLKEQLLITEGKLKESQYQLAPWHSDANPLNYSQSPSYPVEIKEGLELVSQPTYSNGKMPSSDHQTIEGELLGRPQSGLNEAVINLEHNELGGYTHLASRHISSREASTGHSESQSIRNNEEIVGKKVTFGDLVRNRDTDEPDHGGPYDDGEPSANWSSKASAYATSSDDPNIPYSHLPPVLEEPSSSFSEAADDDPLPAIEGLQISGEAYPGRQLRACGYSINGTTSCNFEWIRHLEDGSFSYIDGAKQPNYLVTADDIDAILAIEVQPLDDRKRKGEPVRVFANEHKKVSCEPEMQLCIEQTFYSGHASYKLFVSTGFLGIWEPAILVIKRDGYSIKSSGPIPVSFSEKFSQSLKVTVSQESPLEFLITDSMGIERVLKVDESSTGVSGSRDTIVLTLRLFIMKAAERKKQKKRGIFFNKQRE